MSGLESSTRSALILTWTNVAKITPLSIQEGDGMECPEHRANGMTGLDSTRRSIRITSVTELRKKISCQKVGGRAAAAASLSELRKKENSSTSTLSAPSASEHAPDVRLLIFAEIPGSLRKFQTP